MKKFASVGIIALLALSLAACATTGSGQTTKVKCPACGYEFNAHVETN